MATKKTTTKKTTPAKGKINTVKGRPTKFNQEMIEQVKDLALLGLTDKQMAGVLGITEETFNVWKRTKKDFSESIREGKDLADAKVAKALFKRAQGYVVTEDRMDKNGEVVTLERELPPDTQAASLWLRNRKPEIWRDKQEISQEVTVEEKQTIDPSKLTDDELRVLADIQRKGGIS